MVTKKLVKLSPVLWSVFIFIVAQILTFGVISRENAFLARNQIYVPSQPSQAVSLWPQPTVSSSGAQIQSPAYSSLGPILIYFFSVVIIMGIVLLVIPVSALKLVLRAMFAFLFAWALFIILIFWVPAWVAIPIAAAVGVGWFFFPKIWLHNLLLILAMVGLGAVFGRLLSPWTAILLLLALSVYDFLAVRFGYMIWMAKKMSDTNALPAFFIPKSVNEWKNGLKEAAVTRLVEEKSAERKYSILGGGDIGFPLLLASSVYFAHGFGYAVCVAGFSLFGLLGAYWIQAQFLKGKAMPALPPIAILSLIGLLIISFH